MAVLDFTEIPQANTGKSDQDTFEWFAKAFLEYVGYRIIQGPDRGPDGGEDLIVEETIDGISCSLKVKWLVSCKHFAHRNNGNGKTVSANDEQDIKDRVLSHDCNGFIGFYSTGVATTLNTKLCNLHDVSHVLYTNEEIESMLIKDNKIADFACRYFPKSVEKFHKEHPIPVKIFKEGCSIKCEHCGKELLDEKMDGDCGFNIVLNKSYKYSNVFAACKGVCSNVLEKKYGGCAVFQELSDLKNPIKWLNHVFTVLIDSEQYEDTAKFKLRDIFLNTYPYVIRKLTEEEEEKEKELIYY